MLRRQEELENGTAWSISSESSDDSSSPQLSGSTRHASHKPIVQPEVQASAPAIEISFSQQEEAGAGTPAVAEPPNQQEEPCCVRKEVVANGHVPYSRTLSQISEASVDAAMDGRELQDTGGASAHVQEASPASEDSSARELPLLEINSLPGASNPMPETRVRKDRGQEAKPRAAVSWAEACVPILVQPETALCQALAPQGCKADPSQPVVLKQVLEEERPTPVPAEVPRVKPVDSGLDEAISSLSSALDDYRGQFPELQPLERELKRLEEILMVRRWQWVGLILTLPLPPRTIGGQ